MKANLTSKRLTYFVLFFIVFCMLSCSEKEEQVVSEISLSQPEIEINKLGFGKNGDEAGVEVTSNVYWEITKDENVDWIEVSPMGGTGTTKVVITALKNEGEPRSAELTLETLDGTKKTIQVNQSGGDEVIRFFSSDFGLEPVVEKAPVKAYEQWNVVGVGILGTSFSGEQAYIDSESPSVGYETASGANNVLLDSEDSEFSFGPVGTKSNTSFILSFGVLGEENGLILEISNDDENWIQLPYQQAETAEWSMAQVKFHLLSQTSYMYFRFSNSAGGTYRIDDIQLVKGVGNEGIEIDFDALVDDDKPAGFVYFEDRFDWITEEFGGGDYVGGSAIGQYPPTGPRWDKLSAACKPIWNASGWSVSSGYFTYISLGYVQLGSTTSGGDIISPRLNSYISSYPDIPKRAGIGVGKAVNVMVSFDVSVYMGAGGNQDSDDIIMEVLDAGTLSNKVDKEVKIKVDSWNSWRRIEIPVYGATSDTRIRIKYGVASPGGRNRVFFDHLKVEKAVKE